MKKLTKKVLPIVLAGTMVIGMAMPAMAAETTGDYDAALDFEKKGYEWEAVDKDSDGTVDYYQMLNVAYCENIVMANIQCMNIFAPAEYFTEDGEIDAEGKVNDYTADTAPVIFVNNCQGWMSSKPATTPNDEFIDEGFIHVEAGARSRSGPTNTVINGESVGKAPTPIVDLKSAIRSLKLNEEYIPGDTDCIITWGKSGGGEMSSVLGASGDMEAYYEYLYENKAAGITIVDGEYVSTISDAVYASMCFCPIADIENADLSYSWQRCGQEDDWGASVTRPRPSTFYYTEFKLQLREDLANAYVDYIKGLGLVDGKTALELDGTRGGSYYTAVLTNISDALNKYVAANGDSFMADYATQDWYVKESDGTYKVTDLDKFIDAIGLETGKDIPGYDTFAIGGAETNAFGPSDILASHYSVSVAKVLSKNYATYSTLNGFGSDNPDTVANGAGEETTDYVSEADVQAYIALLGNDELLDVINEQTYLMNATHILLNDEATPAEHWRIRTGTVDPDAGYTIGYNLAVAADMAGSNVDYAMVWDMGHSENEGTTTGTFVEWVKEITPVEDDSTANPPAGDGGTTPQKPTSPQTGAGMSMLPMVIASVAAVAGASLKRREIR